MNKRKGCLSSIRVREWKRKCSTLCPITWGSFWKYYSCHGASLRSGSSQVICHGDRKICHKAEPSQLLPFLWWISILPLFLSLLIFFASFCLIIFSRAAGHFGGCVSGAMKAEMTAARSTQLPDPPDAHCFLMGLLISLGKWLSLRPRQTWTQARASMLEQLQVAHFLKYPAVDSGSWVGKT